MILDLTDEEAAVLAREPTDITFSARYQLSPRVKTLSAILTKLRPQAARPQYRPRPKVYEPPSKGRYRRRHGWVRSEERRTRMILTPTWISIVTAIGAFCVSAISNLPWVQAFPGSRYRGLQIRGARSRSQCWLRECRPGLAAAFGAAISVWALYKLIAAPC